VFLLKTSSKPKITIKDKIFAHLETWRLYTVIWCGLVSLVGSCIAYSAYIGYFTLPPLRISLLAFFIPLMGWTAGLYLSDFLDRKLDVIEKPHRPIPSGRIKPMEALVIGGIFAVTGFFLSFLLSINNIILVFVVAILVFSYSKILKSQGFMGNLNRGIITVAAYFFGVFSIGQSIQSIPIYIWLLALVFLFHDINSNLVGAIRDMEGDKAGGYITIPVRFGLKKSILISLLLTILWLSLSLFLPFYYKFLKTEFYFIMILDILITFSLYIYLFKSINIYSRERALKFHEFFVIERITLASAFIFGIVNIYIAASVYIVAILVTSISQYSLRKRYEFVEKK
jgi:4-hydroxybenzoate polyprenyltransferase/geranylgeranylglycerol-phosphate geranylgeranyltransferase